MELYIDAVRVLFNQTAVTVQPYTGYWRAGYDELSGWPDPPTSNYFNGSLDEIRVYGDALSAQEVFSLFADNESGLFAYYPFNGNSNDESGNNNNAVNSGAVLTADRFARPNKAYQFNGTNASMTSQLTEVNPFPLSISLWFKTNTTNGGKLFGFGTGATGGSMDFDRHIYMTNDGKLFFGVWTGGPQVASTSQSNNNGQWHHVVGIASDAGLDLYVNGSLAISNTTPLAGAVLTGYWKIGFDNLFNWPSLPTSAYFEGALDDIRIFRKVISPGEVTSLFNENPTSADETEGSIPEQFIVYQNYPNPFNGETTVRYQLPADCFVTIKVYDVLGNQVEVIGNEYKSAGAHQAVWNSREKAGGIYYLRIDADHFSGTKVMILLK